MRNDLTANFLAAMASSFRKPIQLIVFNFSDVGNVYLSDRDIVVGGILYKGLVEDWGSLSTSGDEYGISGTMEMSISIWNGGATPFSSNFLYEDPVNVFVDVYQTFEGLAVEDMATIGHFVLQDPVKFSEASQLLQLDLVTTNMRYFAQVGQLLTKENFPYALESDINKPIDLIVGDCGNVKALCSNTPPRTTQSGSILLKPTTINALDSLDDAGFLNSGFIQIDAEIMSYDSRTDSSFHVVIRGYADSIAADHSDGSKIIQADRNIEYIVGEGPITSISNVKVKGQVPTVPFTVHPTENPAVIRFQEQPTFVEYSKGARASDVDFDATASGNGAYQPHYSYSPEERSAGALIDKNNTPLAIIQEDTALDDGEVIRVFLNVEHWATKLYANDRLDVFVDGVGVIGTLSKPNAADIAEFQADVDIDHGHDHQTGGTHDHFYDDSTLETVDPSHKHPLSNATNQYNLYGTILQTFIANSGSNYSLGFGDVAHALRNTLHWNVEWSTSTVPHKVVVKYYKYGTWYTKTLWEFVSAAYSNLGTSGSGSMGSGRIEAAYLVVYNDYSTTYCSNVTAILEKQVTALVEYGNTEVEARHKIGGNVRDEGIDNWNIPIKDSDDVDNLSVTNRELENIVTSSSSRSVLQKFDLTQYLETVSWDWLTDRKIELRYVGATNSAQIIVTYVYFEVEYRQKSIKTTDDVTAYVVGSIENRPDAVIQHLLTEKAGLPIDKLGSVWRSVPIWDDTEIWDDLEVWQDEGQISGVPSGAYFEEAAAWFNFHLYSLDGKIQGNLTVKDAIQKITFQTRSKLQWQNGFAKLVILRLSDSWNIAKDLPTSIIQLRSLSAEKSLSSEIINKIDLFYDLDRLSEIAGEGAYNQTAFRNDTLSIERNGERKKDEMFMFDLIRDTTTAEETADYYIWLLGETRTLYEFNTYLPNFDIEKSDYVTINSTGFEKLKRLPVTVRELARHFGSGKNVLINLLNIIGESIRHKDHLIFEEEEVIVSDTLEILLGSDFTFEDILNVSDELLINQGLFFEEEVVFADSYLVIIMYNLYDQTETVLANDSLGIEIEVNLESNVLIQDDIVIQQELCFGACGFGAPDCVGVIFGSKTLHRGFSDEYLVAEDILSAATGVYETDTILLSDELLFSDGFGCPSGNGSGFGLSPFGDIYC